MSTSAQNHVPELALLRLGHQWRRRPARPDCVAEHSSSPVSPVGVQRVQMILTDYIGVSHAELAYWRRYLEGRGVKCD